MNSSNLNTTKKAIHSLAEQIISLQAKANKHTQLADHFLQTANAINDELTDIIRQHNSRLHKHLSSTGQQTRYHSLKIPDLFRVGDILIDTDTAGDAYISKLPELQECALIDS